MLGTGTVTAGWVMLLRKASAGRSPELLNFSQTRKNESFGRLVVLVGTR